MLGMARGTRPRLATGCISPCIGPEPLTILERRHTKPTHECTSQAVLVTEAASIRNPLQRCITFFALCQRQKKGRGTGVSAG